MIEKKDILECAMAENVSLALCECGHIYIKFHDEDNDVFAVAHMQPKTFCTLATVIAEHFVDQEEGLHVGTPCEGCS